MSTGNQQLLQRYARPIRVSTSVDDTNSPFSFQTWYSVYQGIIPNQEFKQYNEYLTNWYKDRNQQTTDSLLQLKLNYLTLLRQLQVFFTTEEAENWYNQVNIENEKEILLAIPYFARKLRDISVYYLRLRNAIKESRLTYNQTGTEAGLTQQIQKYILTNYTKKPINSITLPASLWKNAPELSAVKETINVELKELYDTGTYFDRSPSLPISAYQDTNSLELKNFLARKGLTTSSIDWIYKLGNYNLFETISTITTGGLSYPEFVEYSKQISEKYLGSEKYIVNTPTITLSSTFFEFTVQEGNNFFYWPQGAYKDFAKTSIRYQDIPLTATNIENIGTAGTTLETADTIFVKTTRGVKGAWLRDEPFIYTKQPIAATFEAQATTQFRFPFPGYGLSADDIQWTGPSLSSDPRFFYLDRNTQQLVLNEYWNTNTFSLTSNVPISINDTTLIVNKAYPNKNFNLADKITIWSNPPAYNAQSFSDETKQAWLYKFDKTDISIKGSDDSLIIWPYETIVLDPETLEFPSYYPQNFNEICSPSPLSSLDFSFATAGDSISSADIIYKISNYLDTPEDATECYWLSGMSKRYEGNISKIQQNCLQGIFQAGTFTQFTWEGPDNTSLNSVFQTISHQPDCKYLNTPNSTYDQFELCTCKQVNFTPFGHPGAIFTEYNSQCDFIFEGNNITDVFDISTWRDSSNTPYLSSTLFFWYRTNSKQGWGDGRWVTGGRPISFNSQLKAGKTYTYYRATTRNEDKNNSNYPELVIRHNYNSYFSNYKKTHVWVKGVKAQNNTWVSTNRDSQAVIFPGDLLIYSRKPNSTTNILGSAQEEREIYENRGSIWASFDYITVNTGIPTSVTFPVLNYPGVTPTSLSAVVDWTLTPPSGPAQIYRNTPGFSFFPSIVGEYSISVRILTATRIPGPTNTLVTITNIPKITAASLQVSIPTLTSFDTSLPGYVLNTPLQGWNYRRSTPSQGFVLARDSGAKPFWAKTYIEKDENTGYKGIDRYGTPQRVVDMHNILTQPEISDISFTPGAKVTYERKYSTNLSWIQPVDFIITSNKKQWCDLEFTTNTVSNLSRQLNNFREELVTNPTARPSTLVLENFVDNEPVEVYYNAISPFVWSITAVSEIPVITISDLSAEKVLTPLTPWANLPNQNYPTAAIVPTIENLYSTTDFGGYFVPKNLGASVYTEHNYLLSLTNYLSSYFNQGKFSRGLTKQDQITPYTITINNTWLKEPTVSGPIAGINNKKIFKKYQKFIPYQSNYESNSRNRIGLLNPNSRQSPWSGTEDSEWGDTANHPRTFTGEVDVKKWADSQVLKQAKLQVDDWVTDIFGNQYGLYKDIKDIEPVHRKDIPGEIWVRNNAQFVSPAYISLANVFDTYKGINLINELTGTGIQKIDMFFDTLMIQTSGTIIFEKLNYDYVTDNIFSLTDESRYLSLAIPVTASFDREFSNLDLYNFAKAGETWFLPNEKIIYLTVCGLKNFTLFLLPELYSYNINTLSLTKIFPFVQEDITIIQQLSSLRIVSFDAPVISYNTSTKQFIIGISARNYKNESIIIEYKINNLTTVKLNDITVYTPLPVTRIQEPPGILDNLNITLTRPDPLGFEYTTTSTLFSSVTANTKIVVRDNQDQTLYLTTVPFLSPFTVYPFLSFSLTGVNDTVFNQPFLNFYSVFQLNSLYVEEYGDEILYDIQPLNFTPTQIINGPVIFTPIDLPSWVNLTPSGAFTGTPPADFNNDSGIFKITNTIGPTFYALNINVV